MEHGERDSGYYITFQDSKAANAEVTTVFMAPQADGGMKIVRSWKGEYSAKGLQSPQDLAIDPTLVQSLKSQQGQINAAALAEVLRKAAVGRSPVAVNVSQSRPPVTLTTDAINPTVPPEQGVATANTAAPAPDMNGTNVQLRDLAASLPALPSLPSSDVPCDEPHPSGNRSLPRNIPQGTTKAC